MKPTQSQMAKIYSKLADETGHLKSYFRLLATTVGTTCVSGPSCGLQACPQCLDDLAWEMRSDFYHSMEEVEPGELGWLRLRVPCSVTGPDLPRAYESVFSALRDLVEGKNPVLLGPDSWSARIRLMYIPGDGKKLDEFKFKVILLGNLLLLDTLDRRWRELLLAKGLMSRSYAKRLVALSDFGEREVEAIKIASSSASLLGPVAHMDAVDAYEYLQLLPKLCTILVPWNHFENSHADYVWTV